MGSDPTTLTLIPAGVERDWSSAWRSWLDASIRGEIDRLRVRYELSLDEFRGLYISDEQVDRLLATRNGDFPVHRPSIPRAGPESPIGRLADEFGLPPPEIAATFISLAPELDRKYETLFAYLNDDVTQRFATVDLCRRLTGTGPEWLDADARIFVEGLLEAVRQGAAAAWRSAAVVVRDPARRFLLSNHDIAQPRPRTLRTAERRIASALGSGDLACVALSGAPYDETLVTARALAAEEEHALIEVRVESGERSRDDLLTARLHRAWAYLPLQLVEDWSSSLVATVRTFAQAPVPTLFGVPRGRPWRRLLHGTDYEVLPLDPPDRAERASLWRSSLHEHGIRASDDDVDGVARLFSLYPEQIRRAATQAARVQGGGTDGGRLTAYARSQCVSEVEDLADRVALVHDWADLVLPAPTLRRLQEFASAVRNRDKVFRDWSFIRAAGGTPSLRALFSGMSGTGKTMSAAVVARDLGVDLYRIDLSAVVSKYIGETEKNLERIFSSAEGSNAILFFDEADALFGKRSEVKDAHDRYANIEIAFLLQRMETYDGVMILATNLAKNLDEAFSRRIQFAIEFPVPDEEQREQLWRLLLPAAAPMRDVDYRFLARQFQLTGGEIRNVALDAAFLAAHEDDEIAMDHLVRAVARQRRKQGKLPTPSEFKHHLATVHREGV
jgi:hypothetical protein